MDLLAFIRTANPTKVKVGERQRAKDEPKLLDSTIGRVVPLLPVALNHTKSELEHNQLFTKFNVGAARQMSLSAEVRMSAEYNIRKKKRLKSVVEKQAELLKVREKEVEDLKAQLLLKEAEAERDALGVKVTELKTLAMGKDRELTNLNAQITSIKDQKDNLVNQVHQPETSSSGLQEKITVYESCIEQLEKFQDAQLKVVNDKVAKLDADVAEMACHLEEKFYPHLLSTISGRKWLLTYGLKLVLVKCLNSHEYLTALGAAISRAIKKGMQDGLAAGIDHDREGRGLMDVAAYNPSADADYNSALQKLRESDIEQLRVPIHRSEDQVVLGETSLSFALSVSHSRVERIRANIAAERVPAATVTTTALSTTFAFASSISPISTNDYEIVDGQEGVGADGEAVAEGNADPFPNVDDAKLHIL
ncbi:hypothetical protein Tco_1219953 [Tanacetum coccineum]